ncbi:hypothetical protein V5O48_008352 [Marasmius crinis-equi]|uniref:Uncharacterized protein n=1 Tax=Marasmius crinis-equi TaxID=585013 RepID=A0ABR3FEC8_9AGAR
MNLEEGKQSDDQDDTVLQRDSEEEFRTGKQLRVSTQQLECANDKDIPQYDNGPFLNDTGQHDEGPMCLDNPNKHHPSLDHIKGPVSNLESDNEEEEKLHFTPSLDHLKNVDDKIALARDYDNRREKAQWTPEQYDTFLDPLPRTWDIDDPDIIMAFQQYLDLTPHCAEERYCNTHRIWKIRWQNKDFLLLEQVCSRFESLTSINPVWTDQCINTCMAFTGKDEHSIICGHCGKSCFDPKTIKLCRQYPSLPLGTQLQAMWQTPGSVSKVQHCAKQTKELLDEQQANGGKLNTYNDLLCGSDYLDLVEEGKIKDTDMVIAILMDGAQIYCTKSSDMWFGIGLVLNHPGELGHKREHVLPLFAIGGLNPPKDYNSFPYLTFTHLAACHCDGL